MQQWRRSKGILDEALQEARGAPQVAETVQKLAECAHHLLRVHAQLLLHRLAVRVLEGKELEQLRVLPEERVERLEAERADAVVLLRSARLTLAHERSRREKSSCRHCYTWRTLGGRARAHGEHRQWCVQPR